MNERGFSVLEVILAAAIFVVMGVSAVIVVLQGLNTNRLGNEFTVANQYASEGVEVARSIKNRAFANLINSAGTGVAFSGGNWTFSGSNNTLVHNTGDNYTRVIIVADVQRDGSGNIVSSGGTVDPMTKKVTSAVSWNFTSARPENISLSTYLSDWRKALPTRGGMLVYGDGGITSDAIKYQILDSTTGNWSSAASTADIDAATTNKYLRSAKVFSSSTRNEKILISRHYNGTSQFIYGQVYNGSTWGNVVLLATLNVKTFLDVRNFDGTYLNNGNFIVVYSDNTTTPKYQTWNGSSWSGQSGTVAVGGIPTYILARARPGTDEVMMATFDQGLDTYTSYYNGVSWSAAVVHSTAAPLNTKESVDFVWSPQNSLKGALVYAPGSVNTLALKIWTANGSGGGGWSSAVNSAASGNKLGPTNIDGRFGSEEFLSCQKDANSDIYCFRGSSTPAWASPTNNILTTTSDTGIQRSFDLSFEAASGIQGIAVYSDNTSTPKLKKYTAGSNSFDASAVSLTTLGGVLKTVRTRPLSDNDDIMILESDANNDLFSVVWNGSADALFTSPAGKAHTAHGTNGSATTDFWYDFAWDKF